MRCFKSVLIASVVAAVFLSSGVLAQEPTPVERPFGVRGVITAIDLAAGAITLNGPLLALRVDALSPFVWVHGQIEKIDYHNYIFALHVGAAPDGTRRIMTFFVDRGTVITKDGEPASWGDLKIGDHAKVAFLPPVADTPGPIRAAIVHACTPPPPVERVCGKLVQIDLDRMILGVLPPNVDCAELADRVMRFRITSETKIDKMGHTSPRALCIGDRVCVGFNPLLDVYPPEAICVKVFPETYRGVIVKVDPERGIVACQNSPMGPVILFKVVNNTRIYKNGRPAPIEALRPRDDVVVRFFHFPESNVASVIVARGPFDFPSPPLP